MKNHLKRLYAPKRWDLLRKTNKFISRPNPGQHSLDHGIPLVVLLRDVLSIAKNSRETKYLMTKHEVHVDGKKRNNGKLVVGLMDTVSFPSMKEHYRIIISPYGKISALKIDEKEAKLKACRIKVKQMRGKKIQVTTHDGKNILTDNNDYRIGDTLLMEMPSQKIVEHLKLAPKMLAYLVGGKHAGNIGMIENVSQNKITYKAQTGEVFETLKEYAFVIGKTSPVITLQEEKNEK